MQAPILKMSSKFKKIHEHAKDAISGYLHHEGQLLLALIEVDKQKIYQCFGYKHLTPYCRKLGLSEDVAAVFVRVVRKSIEIPELAQAVITGDIQITKAKTIASVITKENKYEWISRASSESKFELEEAVIKASGRETKTLNLELTPEEHELFVRVQAVLCAKLDHFPSKEEGFTWMTEFTLNKIDPLRKADRSQDRSGEASVEAQVTHRDRGQCQAELPDGTKCGETKWTHQHHVIPKALGGPDTTENLVTLCASHHRKVHHAHDWA